MRILVCIKQIPDAESRPVITPDRKWAEYGSQTAYRINRFDEHAIEEALSIKDSHPGTVVDVLSIGPEIEMGADGGMHIHLDDTGYTSPSLKARLIANYCSCAKYDLIITGVMSEDMMSGQTGPMTAALLGYPSAAGIMKLEVDASEMKIRVTRELDGSSTSSMDITLPALITVQSGINRPRYPSLTNVMRARTAAITEITPPDKKTPGRHEAVSRILDAKPQRAAAVLQGTITEKAETLWQILHKKSLI